MLFFFNSAPSGCKGGGFILPLLLLRQKHFTQSESFLAWIAHMYFKINALFHSSNLLMLEPPLLKGLTDISQINLALVCLRSAPVHKKSLNLFTIQDYKAFS